MPKRPVRSRVLALAAVVAVGIGALTTVTALAYPGLGPTVTFSVGCASASPGQSCSASACVTDSSGTPVSGDKVSFASSDNAIGRVNPSTATTGSDGCVSGAQFKAGQKCGTVTLTASVTGASAQTQVDVRCGGHGKGGGAGQPGAQNATLPAGSAATPPSAPAAPVAASLPLGAAGVPAGTGLLGLLALLLVRRGAGRRRASALPRGSEDVDEVVPGLLVSSAPRAAARRRLHRAGVTRVVDLRSEASGDAGWPKGVSVERLPVADGQAPSVDDLDALAGRIEEWLRGGQRVLVHCTGGQGRAATVALALLLRRGYDLAGAYRLLRERRPRVAPSDPQLAALRQYEQRLDGARPAS